jgi:hypothetical protein
MQNAAIEDGENIRAGEDRSDMGPPAYVGHAKGVGANTVSELTDGTCCGSLAIHFRIRLSMS